MIAGLSNLATLKSWLLAPGLVAGTDYDDQILQIGRGVASQVETHCRRKFLRVSDDKCEFTADRSHVVVPRYPIEEVTAIELRTSLAEGFVDQGAVDGLIENLSADAGLVFFSTDFGGPRDRIRITYTGGFWFDQSEDGSEEQPEGSVALPESVRLAWLLQCEHVWTQRDKLGLALAAKPSEIYGGALAKIEMLQPVRAALRPFVNASILG